MFFTATHLLSKYIGARLSYKWTGSGGFFYHIRIKYVPYFIGLCYFVIARFVDGISVTQLLLLQIFFCADPRLLFLPSQIFVTLMLHLYKDDACTHTELNKLIFRIF